MRQLIGRSLVDAEDLLQNEKTDYEVLVTSGGKDEELLRELYVIRAKEKGSRLQLLVTGFKTTM